MAVREFDGSDDQITLDNGVLDQIRNTVAFSAVLLVKPVSLTLSDCFVSAGAGTTTIFGLYEQTDGDINWGDADNDEHAFVDLTAGDWQLLGVSWAGGAGQPPRFHRKILGSGSWTHASAGGALVTTATGVTKIQLGVFSDGSGACHMRLATLGLFTSQLSDGNYEGIEAAATTQAIYDLGPAVLCDFNQADTSTPVDDLTGNGSDETAITGTTVINGDDPTGWVFGLEAAAEFVARPAMRARGTSW